VVRIIDRLNIGGPAKHVTWLSAGLDKNRFQTTLITGTVPPGEGDMSYFAREAGLQPVVIPEMSREIGPRDVVVVAKILRELWRIKPQVIHTHKAKAGAVGRAAALIYCALHPGRCRVIHTYHGHIFHSYYSPAKTKLFVMIERALAWLATDRIITISEQQRREIHEEFGVGSAKQMRVIPLGIDFAESPRAKNDLRVEFGLEKDALLVGIVGRLCEVKNHELFLEAAALMLKAEVATLEKVYFVIIGDGHLRELLEKRAKELGIEESVLFTGFRRDANALYDELDLVALTSLNEGTPLTVIEGMSRGRAAVATEVGGVVDLMGKRERVEGKLSIWEHGLTVPSRDAETFAEGMKYLIDRPELREEMGQRGKKFVYERLSKERLISEIEGLYEEVLG
jgi:glycosyltransferase involved in cell wall biosynthesis